MKTQISKPARERTSYTKEYKQEALSLWRATSFLITPDYPIRSRAAAIC